MRVFLQRQKQSQEGASSGLVRSKAPARPPAHREHHFPQSDRIIGDQAIQQTLSPQLEESGVGSAASTSPRLGYDFSRIPLYPRAAAPIQAKLAINKPGDEYEQEADRISEQVMRMPDPQPRASACDGACGTRQTRQTVQEPVPLQKNGVESDGVGETAAPPIVDDVLRSPGQPLDAATRAYFEPRFGHDFSRVRVHTDSEAADSVRSVGALAYTVGPDMVFGAGRYQPHSVAGRQLVAHELVHVMQQSGGARVLRRAVSYSAPSVTTEDPIRRVLRDPRSDLALTVQTVNGQTLPATQDAATGLKKLDIDAATRMIYNAFQPTGIEPKNVPAVPAKGSSPGLGTGSGSGSGSAGKAPERPGSGSGSAGKAPQGSGSGSGSAGKVPEGAGSGSGGSGGTGTATQCGFKDFDVKISANMILPTAPSHGQWGPTYVAASDLGGSPPAVCHGKARIEVVMKGKPDTDTFYQRIKANEQEHVNELKSASDQYLVPYYRDILALRGTGPDLNACDANLQAQRERLPDDKIRNFLTRLQADVQRHDVPPGHPNKSGTHVLDDCNRMEITAEPKQAPPATGTP
jgi:Domain of unknown function (DUF4157)